MRWLWLFLALTFLPASQAKEEFEIIVWSPDGVELTPVGLHGLEFLDPAGNRHFDHPCGTVTTVEVESLPPPGDDDFITHTEKVFELNKRMEVINRWSMPVDSWVMRVSGDSIVVKYWDPGNGSEGSENDSQKYALSISTTGELQLVDKGELSEPEYMDCDVVVERLFGETVYGSCQRIKDDVTGEERIILYQALCT